VYMLAGIVTVQHMGKAQIIPWHLLPWFFAYMLTAIVMFGAMFAAVGSACNDMKEAQSLNIFIMLPVMIPMFVVGAVLKEPLSGFSTALSLFPPFTPILMMLRQCMPAGVPAWQPWVGLAGVVIFTILTVWAGGRIFRVGILMQGQPPKITNLLRWAIRG
ncbi:MAG: ABC transporter permease, partial [bacterium]